MNLAARPIRGPVLDRRRLGTVTALGAGALLAGACTGRGADPAPPAAADEDPDLALVAEVSAVLAGGILLFEETVARHPGLAPRLAGLTDAHRAHQAVLADVVPPTTARSAPRSPSPTPGAPTPVPAQVPQLPRPALAAALAAGSDGADELTRLAFRARSGPLARLVAGMAASTAMHLAHADARLSDGLAP